MTRNRQKGLPLVDNPTAAPRSAPPASEPDGSAPADMETGGSEPGPIMPGTSEPTGSEPAATTTTVPPSRPTPDDVALLGFAQSFELTARDLYQAALDGGSAGSFADVFETLMENHEEYANVMAGIIGVDAPQRRDDAIYEQFFAGFNARLPEAVAQAAYELESAAVATHTDLIGQLVGVDGAATLAALLVVESRHCTVLAHLAGNGDDMAALLENTASPLAPATAGG
jgi:hypothetical protein